MIQSCWKKMGICYTDILVFINISFLKFVNNINQKSHLSMFLLQAWTLYLTGLAFSVFTFWKSKWKWSGKPGVVLKYQRESEGDYAWNTDWGTQQWESLCISIKQIQMSITRISLWLPTALFPLWPSSKYSDKTHRVL